MAGDIKQKIVLEGEKQYSAALKDAQRNLKVLRSELKAETAELGKNATEQQKNETRLKNLKKQIAEQEKVVKTYEAALKEVREKYSDNEEAIARWEIKLNTARTALANMRSGLEGAGESMQKLGANAQQSVVAANSLAESFAKIGSAGGTIAGAIENVFSGITDRIRDTISEVWTSIVDLAARSNNMVDLAGFWGTDVNTIQRYAGAAKEASASLEDINNIVTKINAGDSQKIAELTGISNVNYKDQWKYAMDVMQALSMMDTVQRNAAGFEIFGGRQATKAFDLLNDWGTVMGNLDKYDRTQGGYGLTDEEMQTMSELYDKVNGLAYSWQTLKDMATVQLFGSLSMEITGNIQSIVDSFKEYFLAEDEAGRATALGKVKTNIEALFKTIADGIRAGLKILEEIAAELQNSDDPVLQALGTVLDRIVDAFQWIADPANWGAVKTAFEALIGIWTGAKITQAVGNLASFASNIATVMLAKGLGGGKELVEAAAGAAGGAGSGTGGGALGLLGLVKAAIPNAIAAIGAWKLTELIPADWIGRITGGAAAEVAEIQKNAGIATTGDAMAQVAANPEQSKRSLGLMWEALANPTAGAAEKAAETVAEEVAEAVQEPMTKAQQAALEAFWDAWRADEQAGHTDESQAGFLDAWDAYEAAFSGQEGLFDKVDQLLTEFQQHAGGGWTGIEDLPADFWQNAGGVQGEGISSSDLAGFRSVPAAMAAAVERGAAAGVSGIMVVLDGERVGRLVAPYVSQNIGSGIMSMAMLN